MSRDGTDKVLSCFAEVPLVGVWMKTTKSCRFERPQAFDYPVNAYIKIGLGKVDAIVKLAVQDNSCAIKSTNLF